MKINNLFPSITTDRMEETKAFFVKHFDAVVMFEAPVWISLRLGAPDGPDVALMKAGELGAKPYQGEGVSYNMCVPNVDEVHARLTAAGVVPVMPLEDHPWGDRGFAVADPNGVTLYLFTSKSTGENPTSKSTVEK